MLIYPIFIPFKGCPYHCIYCQQESITHVKEDQIVIPFEQLDLFTSKHHSEDKQIAFFGGTFTAIPISEQLDLLTSINKYIDQNTSIRISTRPDCLSNDILQFLKSHHVKTIELGIQSFDNDVLERSNRLYDASTAIKACRQVKDLGFDLCVQLMPGLPADTKEKFLKSVSLCQMINADYVRIYPTVVLKNTQLADDYLSGKYQLIKEDEMIEMIIEATDILKNTNISLIKIGLHSDLNPQDIISENIPKNIGEIIKGISFLKRIMKTYNHSSHLYISRFDISSVTGNKTYVLNYFKKNNLSLPAHISVDNKLNRSEYYFNEQ